eukprot:g16678.t1
MLRQEEDLCRRIPNLYTSLLNAKRDRMPEKYSDVLFTSDLVVARAAEEYNFEVLPPEQQVKTSLVTAAAPNINFAKEISDLKLMRNSVEAIFIAPRLVRKDINTLVLGAWGCGAFGGDPKEISELFSSVLAELGSLYQEVHFAIPGGKSGEMAQRYPPPPEALPKERSLSFVILLHPRVCPVLAKPLL